MQISTLYDKGATVWIVVSKPETLPVACAVCSSTGVVTLGGEVLRCPKCSGRKSPTGENISAAMSLTVDRVVADTDGSPYRVRYFGMKEDGKHGVFEESEVFATKALAEASLGS